MGGGEPRRGATRSAATSSAGGGADGGGMKEGGFWRIGCMGIRDTAGAPPSDPLIWAADTGYGRRGFAREGSLGISREKRVGSFWATKEGEWVW